MRRAPIVLVSTVAGVSAVLSFHTHPQSPAAIAAAPAASGTASTASSAAKSTQAASGSSGSSSSSGSSGSSKATSSTGTATGTAAQNRYGAVQLKVTVSGGKIKSITPVQLPQGDPKSVQISQYAAPQLQSEALSAQSAQIDGVSGASYTSQSYETSLQSALDKLGFQS